MPFQVPIRENLSALSPYVPGKPVEELEREMGIKDSAKMASNENPLGPSPKVLKAIEKAFTGIRRYPDGSAYNLTRALSQYLNMPESHVILGNGSNELLVLLGQMVLRPGDEVLFAENSFVVYTLTARLFEAEARVIPLKDHTHDLKAFAKALTPKTRLVFICNPNNPTGTIVPLSEITAFLKACPKNVLVVLDEAYYEYVEDLTYFESLKLLRNHSNLAVLRTFSKAFGLAGLRIGYGVVHPELAKVFQKIRQPFNVNHLAMTAAEAALEDIPYMKKAVELNETMRKKLSDGLASMGLEPALSQANFVYFEVPGAPELYQLLLKKGIIVRPMGPSALRVTTGTKNETENFLKVFEEIFMDAKAGKV